MSLEPSKEYRHDLVGSRPMKFRYSSDLNSTALLAGMMAGKPKPSYQYFAPVRPLSRQTRLRLLALTIFQDVPVVQFAPICSRRGTVYTPSSEGEGRVGWFLKNVIVEKWRPETALTNLECVVQIDIQYSTAAAATAILGDADVESCPVGAPTVVFVMVTTKPLFALSPGPVPPLQRYNTAQADTRRERPTTVTVSL